MDQDIKGKGMKSDETALSVDHGKDWVVDGLAGSGQGGQQRVVHLVHKLYQRLHLLYLFVIPLTLIYIYHLLNYLAINR